MSVDIRSSDRRRYINELQAREKEIAAGLLKASQPSSPQGLQENEKRIRREIANSNERRRMQCINAGFSNLRALIPELEGEKLSKAAILQHAAELIIALENDKSKLQSQLDHTKGQLIGLGQDRVVTDAYVSSSPPPSKRKKRDTESSDEGVCSLSDASDDGGSELQRQNVALRNQMDAERQRCADLEERNQILEAQLRQLIGVQAARHGFLSELRPMKLESHQQQDSLYNREMAEVIAPRESLSPSSRFDNFHRSRPRSPTPDRGLQRESSVFLDHFTHGSLMIDSSRYSTGEPMSPVQKMDVVTAGEASLQVVTPRVPSVGPTSITNPTTVLPTADQHSYQHHNYCHRDHPRRRHRQQAQLEQQREEELRLQQQEISVTVPFLYQPKQNTQNLEKLVEAIRQIEGDRALCKFYEEEHKHQNVVHVDESERETSSVSDQDELKSESSGRDSPLHHHLHHHGFHRQNITSDKLATSTNNSSSYSEKYPLASHILQRPLHPSFCRPGVIVHKQ